MKTFIVVQDGAYGISFEIVRAESKERAMELTGGEKWGYAIDLSEYDSWEEGIVYTEPPTGG